MSALAFFNQHIVFRFNEFKQFMEDRRQGVTEKNCHMTLYNYCKKGKITHVRKGLYIVNSDNVFQKASINPFLIAGKATDDATLAYHTALESHGIAYTDFNEHTYLTARNTTSFSFQAQHYRAIHASSPNAKQYDIEKMKILGIEIERTTLERTIVDVLDRPDISGGWEEVIRSLDHTTVFNYRAAIDYVLLLKRASIVAKLGYFLEQRPTHLAVDAKLLNLLLPHIPNQPYYIDRKTTVGRGVYIKKWQLIVPEYLHNREWEEPTDDIDY